MSDGTFTRPPRLFEPRLSDSRASDAQMTDRRGPASDPLLELARLIGQSDPFAPARGRDQSRGAGTERGGHDPMERAPPIRTAARGYPQVQDHIDVDHWREDDRHYDAPSAPPRFPVQPAHPDPAPATGPGNTDYSRHAGFEYPVAPHQAPAGGDEPFNARGGAAFVDPQAARHDPAFGTNDEYSGEYAEPSEYGHEDEYEYETEPEGEPRDDESGIKRRNTTKIVVAVLGLAVFGSAAAFGYRTIFKGGVQGPPPVIRADNSPTKAMPAGTSGEAGLKPINERLGDGSTERMLRREEEPVELRDPVRGANAGAVMPGGGGSFPGAGGFPPATSAPAAAGPTSLTDPKRVRTVTIRADQGAAASERAAPPPTRAASVPRQAAPQSAPQSGSNGAPLAITPQAMGNAEPPPGRIPAAAPAASRATETGGFVVQLAAQKSEAEAQATFRAMQSKYSVLSGHHALIRRKDQGERGVFYASQVGPFGTKDEANQLCESLKTAGATCFVQRN